MANPIELVVEGAVSQSMRARQVSAMFDAPPEEKCRLEWRFDFPYDEQPWNVGLIVGPSGCGKSSVKRHVFGEERPLDWKGAGVVDDFAPQHGVQDVAAVCAAVGFNTIPAWLRPFSVLSNGEKFRVELARRLLEDGDPIVVDEFSSVVDRQVAKIASHACQKYVRKAGRRFVAVTCHYDVLDWLQPDWVLDVATRSFTRRSLQRRPELALAIGRVPRAAWNVFAPFHYLTADMHPAAACYGLWLDGTLANFAGVLHRPQSQGTRTRIWGVSRSVTLPDFQGIGLNAAMNERLGAAYAARGERLRLYPASPGLMRQYDRDPLWRLVKKPGMTTPSHTSHASIGKMGARPCAVFEYAGAPMARADAETLLRKAS